MQSRACYISSLLGCLCLLASPLLEAAPQRPSSEKHVKNNTKTPAPQPPAPAAAPQAQNDALGDRIAAIVGNEIISLREVQKKYKQVASQLTKAGTPLPDEKRLQQQVLQRMIIERAQIQMAKENGIEIDDATLDRATERIAEVNKLTRQNMQAQLAKDGISWDGFREELRNEITIQRLKEREVDSKILITDAEVDNFLNARGNDTKNEIHVAHIMIRIPEGAGAKEVAKIKAQAESVYKQLEKGENFATLAASYSNTNDATRGGDIGWHELEHLPTLYADAARNLTPGKISPLMQSSAGFHILKLLEKRGTDEKDAAPVTQTHARHILIKISDTLPDAEARHRIQTIRERIVSGETDFPEMAKRNSADLSAAKGGDIGWLSPGDTVPDFEQAMNALPINAVSQPVRTPFGWHLIQVIERRTQGMTDERRRMNARAALRERKINEAYEDFLRELRDRTYVDIRLEER